MGVVSALADVRAFLFQSVILETVRTMKAMLLLVMCALPCFARIGETREQCVKRYGPIYEESSDGARLEFRSKGLDVICFFRDGKAWGLSVQVAPKAMTDEEPAGFTDLTASQAEKILQANAGTSKWKLTRYDDGIDLRRYETEDGKILASNGPGGLWIETRERMMEARRVRSEEFIDEVIKGF